MDARIKSGHDVLLDGCGRSLRALVWLFFLLAGCGTSPQAQFYALDPVGSKAPAEAAAGVPISLDAVRLSPILDRQEMVSRGPGDAVEVSDVRRWAAPLDEMTQTVLAQDLAARLPPGSVLPPGSPPPPGPVGSLAVSLNQFDADPDGRVVLEGDWTLSAGSPPQAVLRRHERIEEPHGANQAVAMSAALGRLADRIASEVHNIPDSAR